MKLFVLFIGLVIGSCAATLLHAADQPARQVQLRNGKVWVSRGGATSLAVGKISLPHNVVVETNGTFRVAGGRARRLMEQDILGEDGMLLHPSGTIEPVFDHVTLNRNRLLVMRDGQYTELTTALDLPNRTRIQPDGKIALPNGSSRRLLDGELFRLTGPTVPTRDTVTVQGGRVLVQKDGSMIEVGAGRTIMMNNGTKVFSDGTVVDFDGNVRHLASGEIMVIEGVMVRPR